MRNRREPPKQPILFCRVSWMERYRGRRRGKDIPERGGAYIKKHGTGIEIYNFQPFNGYVYGVVGFGKTNIDRLGASTKDEKIKGVTVIWVATRPEGGSVIVGWYKNATVYRNLKNAPRGARGGSAGYPYLMVTREKDSVLLPIDMRTFIIPRGKYGFGQRQNWYADKPQNGPFRKEVVDYFNSFLKGKKRARLIRRGINRRVDSIKRKEVETAAVIFVWDYFENLGYYVKDVQEDNRGYDLEVIKDNITLFIEVKGLSGESLSVEFTPNEFEYVEKKHPNYRICVVTGALTSKKKLYKFSYSKESRSWEDDEENRLEFEVRKAARGYIA